MSMVRVGYYGLILNISGNQEEEVHLSGGTTVKDLLHILVGRHGNEFGSNILTSDRQLLPLAKIHLNGHDITKINGLDTRLKDNDELTITVLPYVIGGG